LYSHIFPYFCLSSRWSLSYFSLSRLFLLCFYLFFFFHDTASTEIYTLSLHDALPISSATYYRSLDAVDLLHENCPETKDKLNIQDRKSTRLNSSHVSISYAVFCLKKKK